MTRATGARHFKRAYGIAPDDIAFVSDFIRLIDTTVARYGRNARMPRLLSAHRTRHLASMRRVLDCIEEHLDGTLHIGALAAEANLSPFHFVRAFAATFHVTPHQYLQARRAARAKSLLAQRVTPSAAAAAGLTDQSHLNRWFKRSCGVTPAQYQQQIGTRPAAGEQR